MCSYKQYLFIVNHQTILQITKKPVVVNSHIDITKIMILSERFYNFQCNSLHFESKNYNSSSKNVTDFIDAQEIINLVICKFLILRKLLVQWVLEVDFMLKCF